MGLVVAFLATLRVLAIIVAAAGIGLGAWALYLIHDVEIRGSLILKTLILEETKDISWRNFFNVASRGEMRVWVAVGAACFALISGVLIVLAMKLNRLKMSPHFLIPLEFVSMFAMAAAFGVSLSFAVNLDTPCAALDTSASQDLETFSKLCGLSKGYSIGNGAGGLLLTISSLTALIASYTRSHAPESCSFEPTASSLGMGHGYQAVVPPLPRATVPTMYDPLKPVSSPTRPLREDEVGLAEKGASMGMRESTDGRRSEEAEISGPLGLERPDIVKNMRPKRPWSEMRKREGAE